MRSGMYGERQFEQVILRRGHVVIHSGVEESEHDFFLDKGKVLILGIFWCFLYWNGVVEIVFVDNLSLFIEINFLLDDIV